MSTLISDTLKPKSNFSVIDANDVSVDSNFSSSLEQEIGISSNESLGRVKVGETINCDGGEISLNPFVSIGNEEPTDSSDLWINNMLSDEETDSYKDKLLSTDYAPNVNCIQLKDDGLYVKGHKGRIDGVIYLNGIPIGLTKTIDVYINSNTGDDETADGTIDKPFKTWNNAKLYIPHSGWRYQIRLYFYGTFTDSETNIESYACQVNIYMRNTPTFKALRILGCPRVFIYNSFNINMGTPIANARPCFVAYCSWVFINSETTSTTWTVKINGGSTNSTTDVRGFSAEQGGLIQSTSTNAVINVSNCYRAFLAQTEGEIQLRTATSTSTNANGFCAYTGGVIRYTSQTIKATTTNSISTGGRVYYGSQVSHGAY